MKSNVPRVSCCCGVVTYHPPSERNRGEVADIHMVYPVAFQCLNSIPVAFQYHLIVMYTHHQHTSLIQNLNK